jgi:hypothetical protein
MAELRVKKLDDSLMARVKAGAALAGVTIAEFVATLLTEALRYRAGRQRPRERGSISTKNINRSSVGAGTTMPRRNMEKCDVCGVKMRDEGNNCITALKAENATLRAQVERLSAPISPGEVDKHFHRDDWGVPCIYAERFNTIIAARAAGEGK